MICHRTTQSKQRGKLPAVVHPGRVRRTRHPQVLVDGGGGDDVPVDGRRPPVAVRQGDPHHHPTDEPQQQSHDFQYLIHDPTSAQQSNKNISRSRFIWKSQKDETSGFGTGERCLFCQWAMFPAQQICIMIYMTFSPPPRLPLFTRSPSPLAPNLFCLSYFTRLKLSRCLSAVSQGPMVISQC